MKLTFLGAAHEVTGSCSLLSVNGKNILIDCGMEQGEDIYENCELPVSAVDIDAVLLTHAHIDHSGMLPALVAKGFKGNIICTYATFKLCEIMLRDSAHIQEFEAQWRNRKAERAGMAAYVPVYTLKDAEAAIKQFSPVSYKETVEVCEGVTARFTDAGHLLGSSSINITAEEKGIKKTVLFSGDLGNTDRPLIRDPQIPEGAQYVVIESTYGDRLHGDRPDYVTALANILNETFKRGGNVVIPSFAVGRTQELLYLLRKIKEDKLVSPYDFPVLVDSPLAAEATGIYSSGLTDYYDEETLDLLSRGIDPIKFDDLKLSVTSDDSKMINFDPRPKVILSASGMCEAGRIRHHLKHNLWRKDSTILFVGYQAEGTVGRKLIDGASSVKLFGEVIAVNAKIETLHGISGHADRDMLLQWLNKLPEKPKHLFVNHGNDSVCDYFADLAGERLEINATAPYSGDEFELTTDECTAKGKVIRTQKAQSKGRIRANTVYSRMLEAAKRLLSLVSNSNEIPNKDMAKFADQITSLCDKLESKR